MSTIVQNAFRAHLRKYSVLGAKNNLNYVPPSSPVGKHDTYMIEKFVNESQKLLVITGAGISTESGIPDYRSEGVGLYARSSNRPVQYQDFIKRPEIRQRYWARNFVGWPTFSSVQPNDNHHILSSWENQGKVLWLVTQNVDALHRKAGSENLTELHGSAHRVQCLNCDNRLPRTRLQEIIQTENPHWHSKSVEMAPDGDVQLSQKQIDGFQVPSCEMCGGILKPEIIFFGDNVPRFTVDFLFEKVKECDSILVLGSSLEVYSGYRFVNKAFEQEKPIAIVNIGQTRADKLASVKVSAKCSDILNKVKLIS